MYRRISTDSGVGYRHNGFIYEHPSDKRHTMSMRQKLEEYAEDTGTELLFADGFDDAIIGVGVQASRNETVVYDHRKCVEILMERDDMTEEDADEYMSFNVTSAWVGDGTPIFVLTDFNQE